MNILKLSAFLSYFLLVGFGNSNIENVFFAREVPQDQYYLYEALIPTDIPGFKMPDQPLVTVSMAMLGDQGYLEMQILMRVNYKGEDQYWGIYQPLNNMLGYWTGVNIGFPKKLVDICSYPVSNGYVYNVDSCTAPSIGGEWRADNRARPVARYLDEVINRKGLLTVGKNQCVKRSTTIFERDPANPGTIRNGYVNWKNNLNIWWAELIPTGQYASEFIEIDYKKVTFGGSPDLDCNGYSVKSPVPGAENPIPAPSKKATVAKVQPVKAQPAKTQFNFARAVPAKKAKPAVNNVLTNKALNKPARVSTKGRCCEAGMVNDGKANTRWMSWFFDNQSVTIDLESKQAISQVNVDWTTNDSSGYAAYYEVQVSNNQWKWTTVSTVENNNAQDDVIKFPKVDARYVRLNLIKRGTKAGFSIDEIAIY